MIDELEKLKRENEQLRSKSNQRKRTLHNHKNKLQQAKKLLIEVDDLFGKHMDKSWHDKLKLLKVKK